MNEIQPPRNEVSVDQFKQRLKLTGSRGSIDNLKVTGIIDDSLSRSSTAFEFNNCQLDTFKYPNSDNTDVTFKNCVINQLEFSANDSVLNLTFDEGCRIERLIFPKTFEGNGKEIETRRKVVINKCNIRVIEFSQLFSELHFINSDSETILIEKGCYTNLSIDLLNNVRTNEQDNVSGKNEKKITELVLKGKTPNVHISGGKIGKLIVEQKVGQKMTLVNVKNDKFLFDGAVIRVLEFHNCDLIDVNLVANQQVIFLGGTCKRLFVSKIFGGLSTGKDKKEVVINELNLKDAEGDLDINHTTVNTLSLNGFYSKNAGEFRFLTVKEALEIENAKLPNSIWNNVDLSKAVVKLFNSSLKDSELINVNWKQLYEYKEEMKGKGIDEKLKILNPLRESYRQIKVLLLNQNNKIDALNFLKHELKVYHKIVHLSCWRKGGFLRNFGNWLILSTNWIFSDFGLSWFLPLIWLFGVHSILFYCLLETHPLMGLSFSLTDFECEATREGLGMYLNLLSPVHTTEIRNPWANSTEPPVTIFGTIDFFMRLCNAYFIYYFLKATRKFNLSLN